MHAEIFLKFKLPETHASQEAIEAFMSALGMVIEPQGVTVEEVPQHFHMIRNWAEARGIYAKGNPHTQTVKLMEETGELAKAVLTEEMPAIIDGIGDCVVVLTNLAALCGLNIEACIGAAYDEIANRKGQMQNGTFVKEQNQ